MFTVPLYHYTIDNWPENQQKLINIANEQSFRSDNKVGNVDTSYGLQLINDGELQKILQPTLDEFMTESKIQDLVVTDLWFQRYSQQQFHAPHNHGPLGFSSVLYIKYDPTIHKATRFISPFPDTKGNTIDYSPQDEVNEGSWIFWPSFLNHYVVPNKTDEERIILSANMMNKA
jgi:hypothetical protein